MTDLGAFLVFLTTVASSFLYILIFTDFRTRLLFARGSHHDWRIVSRDLRLCDLDYRIGIHCGGAGEPRLGATTTNANRARQIYRLVEQLNERVNPTHKFLSLTRVTTGFGPQNLFLAQVLHPYI